MAAQPQRGARVAVGDGEADGRADVLAVGVHAVQPGADVAGLQARVGAAGERPRRPARGGAARLVAALGEPLERVLAHRLEHPEAAARAR